MNSHLESSFLHYWHILAEPNGAPPPQREYKFSARRNWKADFAFPLSRLLVEIEGGTRQLGRHSRHEGFQNDCYKYNSATADGWRVLRYTSEMLLDDPVFVVNQICQVLGVQVEVEL